MNALQKQWKGRQREAKIGEDMLAYAPLLRYAQSEPDLPHLFKHLSAAYGNAQSDLTLAVVQVFTAALEILRKSSLRGIASKAGRVIIKDHMKIFYRFLSSGHNAIVGPTLDLMTAVASIDPSLNESFFTTFDFSLRAFVKFPMMRKKKLADTERHDIRTAYLHFILCFLEHGNYNTKMSLSKMQNLLGPIFAGLAEDPKEIIQWVFEIIWTYVVLNEKKNKALTISFFYSATLTKLAKLYESNDEEIVNLGDSFLRALCTNDESGLCYPISLEADHSGVVRNKIILEFLLTFAPLESLKKQDLCLDLLQACPDLFSAYWNRSGFIFDPEASVRYINLVSFAVRVFNGVPVLKTLTADLNDIFFSKAFHKGATFVRGLSHSNKLVFYSTSLLFLAFLQRTTLFVERFEENLIDAETQNVSMRLENRDKLLKELLELVPNVKSLHTLLNNVIKSEAPRDILIAKNMLSILGLYQTLFSHIAEVPAFSIPTHDYCPILNLSICRYLSTIGQYESAFFGKLQDCWESRQVVAHFARTLIIQSGFIRIGQSAEVAFWKAFVESSLLSESLTVVSKLNDSCKHLASQQFAQEIGDISPIMALMDSWIQEKYRIFAKSFVNSYNLKLEAPSSRTVLEQGQEKDVEVTNSDTTLIGNSFESVASELFSRLKPDVVLKALRKQSLTNWKDASQLNREEIEKAMLVDLDASLWIQFLAKLLVGNWNGDLRIIIETGSLGFAFFALSSPDEHFRKAAHFVLETFYNKLANASFRERREVTLLFDCLRNSLTDSSRVPTVVGVFCAESLQVLLRPAHFMYTVVMEFLLGNHSIDLKRIPLLSECLTQFSDEQFAKHQTWMLRILQASLQKGLNVDDFRDIFLPNHVLDTILEMILSPMQDGGVEQGCKKLLLSIVKLDDNIKGELKEKYGLLAWAVMLPRQKSHFKNELISALH